MKLISITPDASGNPRYVCHFLDLLNKEDEHNVAKKHAGISYIDKLYEFALKKSKRLGGRKYHTKTFGGGIVFQSYNVRELTKKLRQLAKKTY